MLVEIHRVRYVASWSLTSIDQYFDTAEAASAYAERLTSDAYSSVTAQKVPALKVNGRVYPLGTCEAIHTLADAERMPVFGA